MILNRLFVFMFLMGYAFLAHGEPKVFYIDLKGEERLTDWKVHQTYIWKKMEKFRVVNKQTWIALPPLLEIGEATEGISIIENSKENNSPFASDPNIKKVLVFEHVNPTQIVPLMKMGAVPGSSKVAIKVQDSDYKTHISISDSCKELGLELDVQKSNPYVLSMDCQKAKNYTNVLVGFSGKLKGIQAMGGEILSSQVGVHNVLLNYKKDETINQKHRFVANLSVETEGDKRREQFSVMFKQPAATEEKVITVSSQNTGVLGEKMSKHPSRNALKKDFKFTTGLLSSKIGLEAYASAKVFFYKSTQFLNGQISFPLNYIGSSRRDRSYLDTSLTYNWKSQFFSVGTGLRMISLSNDSRRPFDYGPVYGLNIRLAADSVFRFSKEMNLGMAISYMPFAFDRYLKAQRLRWHILNLSFIENSSGRLSALFYYDLLQIKEAPFEFGDYKFVGGVTYQW